MGAAGWHAGMPHVCCAQCVIRLGWRWRRQMRPSPLALPGAPLPRVLCSAPCPCLPTCLTLSTCSPSSQKVEERKVALETARQETARMVLAGKSILVPWGTDDPFADMSPQVGSAPWMWVVLGCEERRWFCGAAACPLPLGGCVRSLFRPASSTPHHSSSRPPHALAAIQSPAHLGITSTDALAVATVPNTAAAGNVLTWVLPLAPAAGD